MGWREEEGKRDAETNGRKVVWREEEREGDAETNGRKVV